MAERDRAREWLARDALWRAWYEVAHGGVRLDETGGAESVARLVLADPIQWQRALGWQHEYENRDDTLPVCLRCGVEITPLGPRLCPGESGPS